MFISQHVRVFRHWYGGYVSVIGDCKLKIQIINKNFVQQIGINYYTCDVAERKIYGITF